MPLKNRLNIGVVFNHYICEHLTAISFRIAFQTFTTGILSFLSFISSKCLRFGFLHRLYINKRVNLAALVKASDRNQFRVIPSQSEVCIRANPSHSESIRNEFLISIVANTSKLIRLNSEQISNPSKFESIRKKVNLQQSASICFNLHQYEFGFFWIHPDRNQFRVIPSQSQVCIRANLSHSESIQSLYPSQSESIRKKFSISIATNS